MILGCLLPLASAAEEAAGFLDGRYAFPMSPAIYFSCDLFYHSPSPPPPPVPPPPVLPLVSPPPLPTPSLPADGDEDSEDGLFSDDDDGGDDCSEGFAGSDGLGLLLSDCVDDDDAADGCSDGKSDWDTGDFELRISCSSCGVILVRQLLQTLGLLIVVEPG